MNKDLFFDYGELLFAYRFTPETLRRADEVMLQRVTQFGKNITANDLSQAHKQAIQAYLRSRDQSGQEWPMDRIMGLALSKMGIKDERAIDLAVETYKMHDHDEFPLPGIKSLVPELARGHQLHIVSNLPHNSPLTTLRNHGLLDYFSTVTFSYEAGYRKPRPEIYQLALKKAKCSPEKGIFISHDQEEVDGAKRVGMQAFLATNADEIRGALHENSLY